MSGTTDRDAALAEALRQLPVPDHGDGFWAGVAARMHDAAPTAPTALTVPDANAAARAGDRAPAPAAGPAAVAPGGPPPGPGRPEQGVPGAGGPSPDPGQRGRGAGPDRQRRGGPRTGRRPRPGSGDRSDRRSWFLVAAVLVVVAGIGIGVLVGIVGRERRARIETIDRPTTTTALDGSEPGATSSTASSTTASPVGGGTTVTAVGRAPGGPVQLGLGQPVDLGTDEIQALTSDGSSALVFAEDPDLKPGSGDCQPVVSLYLRPLGSTTRTRVGSPGAMVGETPIVGPGGRLAVPYACGVVGPFTVARVGADGSLTDQQQFPVNLTFPGGAATSADWKITIQWTVDGSALLMATGAGAFRVEPPASPTAGSSGVGQRAVGRDLGLGRVVALGQSRSGGLAVVLADGRVQLAGVTLGSVTVDAAETIDPVAEWDYVHAMYGIGGVAVDDAGVVWVASLRQGLVRLTPGQAPTVVDPTPTAVVVAHPGGGVLWQAVPATTAAMAPRVIRTLAPDGTVIDLAADSPEQLVRNRLDATGRAVLRTSGEALWTGCCAGAKQLTSSVLPVVATG